MHKLLVVDDDMSLRTILHDSLSASGFDVTVAKDGPSALEAIQENAFDLAVSDLMMPGMSGIQLMEEATKIRSDLGFLIVTAYGTVETAVEALHKGAFDFITKPFSMSQLESRVQRYFDFEDLKKENRTLKRTLSNDRKYTRLVGKSSGMEQVLNQINMVAPSDAPVFIQGESGTGKELIAQSIHENSERSHQPFLKVNCSAIPETLFESTLFGHEKGAFTNAIKMHKGLFEEAHGGTLLLDEISEIPTPMQAKLLRVLQNHTVTRVGNTQEIEVDVRIIATSNRNLERMIKEEKFRADLFYRLNVFPIKVPSLRERPDDVPILVSHFLKKFKRKYKYDQKEVTSATMNLLNAHSWPGNVRQLENLMERAILYSGQGSELLPEHFSLDADEHAAEGGTGIDMVTTIAEAERQLIINALKRTRNNRTQAAELLGISVRTLRNKVHQYEEEGQPIPGLD